MNHLIFSFRFFFSVFIHNFSKDQSVVWIFSTKAQSIAVQVFCPEIECSIDAQENLIKCIIKKLQLKIKAIIYIFHLFV